ncbi:MAG: hypothetical protein WAN58_09355, partial [Anaerolineales bacterium]
KTDVDQTVDANPEPERKPSPSLVRALWLLLSACASILYLATTSPITQDVAVIPFLWVLPLTIYLLTFIFAFSSEKWYSRQIFLVLFFLASIAFVWALYAGPTLGLPLQLIVYSIALFIACMVCHGELYRLRPDPAYLTNFYLMVSIGGALGGIFVNFVAPYLFRGYWELPLGMIFVWVLLFMIMTFRPLPRRSRSVYLLNQTLMLSGVILFGILGIRYIFLISSGSLFSARNFYGVERVQQQVFPGSGLKADSMVSGITVHGLQVQDALLKDLPTAYYYQQSGIGLALLNYPRSGRSLRVGVLGLGAGTLAVYGQPGDVSAFTKSIWWSLIWPRERAGSFRSYLTARPKLKLFRAMPAFRWNRRSPAAIYKTMTSWCWIPSAVIRFRCICLIKRPLLYICVNLHPKEFWRFISLTHTWT